MTIAFCSKWFPLRLTVLFGLLGAGCEPVSTATQAVSPLSEALEGQWRYKAGYNAFYNWRHQLLNKSTDSTGSNLLIGATNWQPLDGFPAQHTYTRSGDTLLISRRGDQHLVDLHYIRPEEIGKIIGWPTKLRILSLTAHQLVVQDSTIDPDGSLIRVGRSYYAR
jgi:hypothetical protein